MSTSSRSSGALRMPVLFVGHGSPMNAIEDNVWSRGFRDLAGALPRPKAILAVSAHWYVEGTFTTANERPKTIHDFGGFPDALFRVQYPAPGDPDLAKRVVELVGERRASVDDTWGLDHGTWSVLVHLLPAADVPVVQLSIDGRLAPAEHLAIGRALEGDAGRLSHPTPDHYLPLLYAAGASTQDDAVRFPIEGFDMASLSMRSVVFG